MSLTVIGAGFGRTGTDSLRHALNMLGVGPCHHMHEVQPSETQRERWQRKAAGEDVPWDELLEGFRCCVDWPTAAFWEDLLDHAPDARVILTARDPQSWWASYEKTILQVLKRMEGEGGTGMPYRIVGLGVFGGRYDDKDHVLRVYAENEARVRDTVPADRLLVMELGSGWRDLCPFLGLDAPDAPYPSGNDSAAFRARQNIDG